MIVSHFETLLDLEFYHCPLTKPVSQCGCIRRIFDTCILVLDFDADIVNTTKLNFIHNSDLTAN